MLIHYYQAFYYTACESDHYMTMHLALLGILHKTDKQLALLCFGMFVIKREKSSSFNRLCYCQYFLKGGKM